SLRHDQSAHGGYALPDENTAKGRRRNGALSPCLQPDARNQHPRHRALDRGHPRMKAAAHASAPAPLAPNLTSALSHNQDPKRKSQLVCWSVANDTPAMAINTDILKALVEDELARMADARVTTQIRSLLTEPKPFLRDWDYGEKGQQYVCWIVLEDHSSK